MATPCDSDLSSSFSSDTDTLPPDFIVISSSDSETVLPNTILLSSDSNSENLISDPYCADRGGADQNTACLSPTLILHIAIHNIIILLVLGLFLIILHIIILHPIMDTLPLVIQPVQSMNPLLLDILLH